MLSDNQVKYWLLLKNGNKLCCTLIFIENKSNSNCYIKFPPFDSKTYNIFCR